MAFSRSCAGPLTNQTVRFFSKVAFGMGIKFSIGLQNPKWPVRSRNNRDSRCRAVKYCSKHIKGSGGQTLKSRPYRRTPHGSGIGRFPFFEKSECEISRVHCIFSRSTPTNPSNQSEKEAVSHTQQTFLLPGVPLMGFRSNSKFDQNLECFWFRTCSTDHNEILHMSRQRDYRDGCKMSLWSAKYVMKKTITKFHWIAISIEIALVRSSVVPPWGWQARTV